MPTLFYDSYGSEASVDRPQLQFRVEGSNLSEIQCGSLYASNIARGGDDDVTML